MIRTDHHKAGEFSLRAAVRLQGDAGKTSDLSQPRLQVADHLLIARRLFKRNKGMYVCEFRPRDGQHLGSGVEFHRTRPQWDHGMNPGQVLFSRRLGERSISWSE